MAKFFTSDTHFQHAGRPVSEGGSGGVITMCNRPFANIEEHDEGLIARWNEVVGPKDDVYHLGDFALGDQSKIPEIVSRLNGRIHLHWGNHDSASKIRNMGCFASLQDVSSTKVNGNRIFMSHYGHRVWDRSHYGVYHLYGHSHGGLPPWGRSLDVGVDCFDYRPVLFEEIVQRLIDAGTHDAYMKHHPED